MFFVSYRSMDFVSYRKQNTIHDTEPVSLSVWPSRIFFTVPNLASKDPLFLCIWKDVNTQASLTATFETGQANKIAKTDNWEDKSTSSTEQKSFANCICL